MKTLKKAPLFVLLVAASALAADSPIAGTWTAKMHDLPAIKMTVKDSGGKLSGNIIFYLLMLENGTWKVKGDATTDMIEPRLEGRTFIFAVRHAKKHRSTDPADQEIKTFRLQLTGPNEAVFKNADNGQDLKLTRQ
jgi:hypothetical protein